jgi:hypothetical protein
MGTTRRSSLSNRPTQWPAAPHEAIRHFSMERMTRYEEEQITARVFRQRCKADEATESRERKMRKALQA